MLGTRRVPSAAIGFDLDGVIMRGPWLGAVRPRVWSHLTSSPGVAHLAAEERERRVSEAVLHVHQRRLQDGEFVEAWNWDAIYAEVAQTFGGTALPALAQIVRECCQLQGSIELLPGARSGLERIQAAGLRSVAISNGYYDYQWPVLQALDVAPLFSDVVTPDRAGYAKPDPHIFLAVPGIKAHVGDILLHDVLGANLAGLCSVWLHPELPDEFRLLPPSERPRMRGFAAYLEQVLETSRYRRYHPEGTLETCTPDVVALDVDEAAAALLSINV
jgi:putative hydrolase of the HAD superfamily